MTIPTVATVVAGTVVDPDWGNDVANSANRQSTGIDFLAFTPSGNIDAETAGVETDWVTLGSITVPTWATTAYVVMTIAGPHMLTAASTTYNLRTRIGTDNASAVSVFSPNATASRHTLAWSSKLTVTSTGAKNLIVRAVRTGGTGQMRADTVSRCDAIIIYR